MKTGKSWSILMALALAAVSGPAAAIDDSAGTATGSILKMGGSARSLAMGGSGAVLQAESGALWVNPGQMAGTANAEFSYTHGQWVEDVALSELSFASPVLVGCFGAAVNMMDMGSIECYDNTGGVAESAEPKDTAVTAGYALEVGKAGVGASITYIKSELASDATVEGFAIDFGGRYIVWQDVVLGAAVQHLGPGLKYGDKASNLPLTIRGGASGTMLNKRLLLAADVLKPSDGGVELLAGAELSQPFTGDITLSLRGGWRSVAPEGSNAGLSAGGGLRWMPKKPLGTDEDLMNAFGDTDSLKLSGIRLDYAWTPMGELGAAHWLSFAIVF